MKETAYDKIADLVMHAPQYPTVNRDLLQGMLREYRELFLAVEARGFDPHELVKEHKQNKHKHGRRTVEPIDATALDDPGLARVTPEEIAAIREATKNTTK